MVWDSNPELSYMGATTKDRQNRITEQTRAAKIASIIIIEIRRLSYVANSFTYSVM